MLKRITPRERLEQLVSSYEPLLRAAFMAAVDDIRSNIVLRRIVERLEKGDISGAIDAMFIEEAAFNPLEEALRQAFNAGGVDTVSNMPTLKDPDGYAIVIRWDARNVAAESWLLDHSSYLVTNIISDQREAIRTTLTESLARGDNPTKAAKAIVGPVNRADQVEKITGRYAAGLLKLRADTIALNETFQAMAAAKDMAFRQQIENGNLSAGVVTKTWRHTPQEHGRLQHIAMNGQKVGYDQPFVAPDGTQIMYPHAPGTPARHMIGCKCVCEYSIDHVANLING